MINIKNKADCCGCSACFSICGRKAINFVVDSEGFNYPQVDKEKCVNCNLCDTVCPIQIRKQTDKTVETPLQYKAVRIKDKDILQNSSSGGAFSILANIVFDMGVLSVELNIPITEWQGILSLKTKMSCIK